MEKITIVICSRMGKDDCPKLLKNINETCGVEYEIKFIKNTEGVSLSSIYHHMFNQSSTDIIVFMHDDIEYLKTGWGKELIRMFNEHQDYGIIGVAGSAEYDKDGVWWQKKKSYGQIVHKYQGKVWLTIFSPLLKNDLEEVCVIDGLFMAVCKPRIINNFDENLEGFHMYDIDFCLSNYFTKAVKIGVTTNIRIAHKSIGQTNESWVKNKELMVKRYGDKFPISIRKNKR